MRPVRFSGSGGRSLPPARQWWPPEAHARLTDTESMTAAARSARASSRLRARRCAQGHGTQEELSRCAGVYSQQLGCSSPPDTRRTENRLTKEAHRGTVNLRRLRSPEGRLPVAHCRHGRRPASATAIDHPRSRLTYTGSVAKLAD